MLIPRRRFFRRFALQLGLPLSFVGLRRSRGSARLRRWVLAAGLAAVTALACACLQLPGESPEMTKRPHQDVAATAVQGPGTPIPTIAGNSPKVIIASPHSSPETDQLRAESVARQHMQRTFGAAIVERSRVESRFGHVGWTVIFHDANVTCHQGGFWPALCDLSRRPPVFRDAWLWIPPETWQVEKVGGCEYPAFFGPQWRCQLS